MVKITVVHMTETKREILAELNKEIDFRKNRRKLLIDELMTTEKKLDETQSLINELMGLPVKRD